MSDLAPVDFLIPGFSGSLNPADLTIVDIREPEERVGNPEWIQNTPNMPSSQWLEIPEKIQQRPIVLCCAAGIRTRQCLALLNNPEGVYAWTRPIQDIPAEWQG